MDLVLLGGTKAKPKALIVELKQWSSVKEVPGQQLVDVPREGRASTPANRPFVFISYRGN